MAQALRARGVGRGHRVGLCVERGVDMLAAVLGILKAGAAYVPLDPAFPQERLRFMAEDAQLELLVSTSALAGSFGLPRERQLLLDTDAAALAAQSDQRLTPDAALDARPEDPAYVIYTSGSTGKPKGVRDPAPRGRQLPRQHGARAGSRRPRRAGRGDHACRSISRCWSC